ncbi:MAG: hypothetical protein WDW38_007465 [Sanguina aurantia]
MDSVRPGSGEEQSLDEATPPHASAGGTELLQMMMLAQDPPGRHPSPARLHPTMAAPLLAYRNGPVLPSTPSLAAPSQSTPPTHPHDVSAWLASLDPTAYDHPTHPDSPTSRGRSASDSHAAPPPCSGQAAAAAAAGVSPSPAVQAGTQTSSSSSSCSSMPCSPPRVPRQRLSQQQPSHSPAAAQHPGQHEQQPAWAGTAQQPASHPRPDPPPEPGVLTASRQGPQHPCATGATGAPAETAAPPPPAAFAHQETAHAPMLQLPSPPHSAAPSPAAAAAASPAAAAAAAAAVAGTLSAPALRLPLHQQASAAAAAVPHQPSADTSAPTAPPSTHPPTTAAAPSPRSSAASSYSGTAQALLTQQAHEQASQVTRSLGGHNDMDGVPFAVAISFIMDSLSAFDGVARREAAAATADAEAAELHAASAAVARPGTATAAATAATAAAAVDVSVSSTMPAAPTTSATPASVGEGQSGALEDFAHIRQPRHRATDYPSAPAVGPVSRLCVPDPSAGHAVRKPHTRAPAGSSGGGGGSAACGCSAARRARSARGAAPRNRRSQPVALGLHVAAQPRPCPPLLPDVAARLLSAAHQPLLIPGGSLTPPPPRSAAQTSPPAVSGGGMSPLRNIVARSPPVGAEEGGAAGVAVISGPSPPELQPQVGATTLPAAAPPAPATRVRPPTSEAAAGSRSGAGTAANSPTRGASSARGQTPALSAAPYSTPAGSSGSYSTPVSNRSGSGILSRRYSAARARAPMRVSLPEPTVGMYLQQLNALPRNVTPGGSTPDRIACSKRTRSPFNIDRRSPRPAQADTPSAPGETPSRGSPDLTPPPSSPTTSLLPRATPGHAPHGGRPGAVVAAGVGAGVGGRGSQARSSILAPVSTSDKGFPNGGGGARVDAALALWRHRNKQGRAPHTPGPQPTPAAAATSEVVAHPTSVPVSGVDVTEAGATAAAAAAAVDEPAAAAVAVAAAEAAADAAGAAGAPAPARMPMQAAAVAWAEAGRQSVGAPAVRTGVAARAAGRYSPRAQMQGPVTMYDITRTPGGSDALLRSAILEEASIPHSVSQPLTTPAPLYATAVARLLHWRAAGGCSDAGGEPRDQEPPFETRPPGATATPAWPRTATAQLPPVRDPAPGGVLNRQLALQTPSQADQQPAPQPPAPSGPEPVPRQSPLPSDRLSAVHRGGPSTLVQPGGQTLLLPLGPPTVGRPGQTSAAPVSAPQQEDDTASAWPTAPEHSLGLGPGLGGHRWASTTHTPPSHPLVASSRNASPPPPSTAAAAAGAAGQRSAPAPPAPASSDTDPAVALALPAGAAAPPSPAAGAEQGTAAARQTFTSLPEMSGTDGTPSAVIMPHMEVGAPCSGEPGASPTASSARLATGVHQAMAILLQALTHASAGDPAMEAAAAATMITPLPAANAPTASARGSRTVPIPDTDVGPLDGGRAVMDTTQTAAAAAAAAAAEPAETRAANMAGDSAAVVAIPQAAAPWAVAVPVVLRPTPRARSNAGSRYASSASGPPPQPLQRVPRDSNASGEGCDSDRAHTVHLDSGSATAASATAAAATAATSDAAPAAAAPAAAAATEATAAGPAAAPVSATPFTQGDAPQILSDRSRAGGEGSVGLRDAASEGSPSAGAQAPAPLALQAHASLGLTRSPDQDAHAQESGRRSSSSPTPVMLASFSQIPLPASEAEPSRQPALGDGSLPVSGGINGSSQTVTHHPQQTHTRSSLAGSGDQLDAIESRDRIDSYLADSLKGVDTGAAYAQGQLLLSAEATGFAFGSARRGMQQPSDGAAECGLMRGLSEEHSYIAASLDGDGDGGPGIGGVGCESVEEDEEARDDISSYAGTPTEQPTSPTALHPAAHSHAHPNPHAHAATPPRLPCTDSYRGGAQRAPIFPHSPGPHTHLPSLGPSPPVTPPAHGSPADGANLSAAVAAAGSAANAAADSAADAAVAAAAVASASEDGIPTHGGELAAVGAVSGGAGNPATTADLLSLRSEIMEGLRTALQDIVQQLATPRPAPPAPAPTRSAPASPASPPTAATPASNSTTPQPATDPVSSPVDLPGRLSPASGSGNDGAATAAAPAPSPAATTPRSRRGNERELVLSREDLEGFLFGKAILEGSGSSAALITEGGLRNLFSAPGSAPSGAASGLDSVIEGLSMREQQQQQLQQAGQRARRSAADGEAAALRTPTPSIASHGASPDTAAVSGGGVGVESGGGGGGGGGGVRFSAPEHSWRVHASGEGGAAAGHLADVQGWQQALDERVIRSLFRRTMQDVRATLASEAAATVAGRSPHAHPRHVPGSPGSGSGRSSSDGSGAATLSPSTPHGPVSRDPLDQEFQRSRRSPHTPALFPDASHSSDESSALPTEGGREAAADLAGPGFRIPDPHASGPARRERISVAGGESLDADERLAPDLDGSPEAWEAAPPLATLGSDRGAQMPLWKLCQHTPPVRPHATAPAPAAPRTGLSASHDVIITVCAVVHGGNDTAAPGVTPQWAPHSHDVLTTEWALSPTLPWSTHRASSQHSDATLGPATHRREPPASRATHPVGPNLPDPQTADPTTSHSPRRRSPEASPSRHSQRRPRPANLPGFLSPTSLNSARRPPHPATPPGNSHPGHTPSPTATPIHTRPASGVHADHMAASAQHDGCDGCDARAYGAPLREMEAAIHGLRGLSDRMGSLTGGHGHGYRTQLPHRHTTTTTPATTPAHHHHHPHPHLRPFPSLSRSSSPPPLAPRHHSHNTPPPLLPDSPGPHAWTGGGAAFPPPGPRHVQQAGGGRQPAGSDAEDPWAAEEEQFVASLIAASSPRCTHAATAHGQGEAVRGTPPPGTLIAPPGAGAAAAAAGGVGGAGLAAATQAARREAAASIATTPRSGGGGGSGSRGGGGGSSRFTDPVRPAGRGVAEEEKEEEEEDPEHVDQPASELLQAAVADGGEEPESGGPGQAEGWLQGQQQQLQPGERPQQLQPEGQQQQHQKQERSPAAESAAWARIQALLDQAWALIQALLDQEGEAGHPLRLGDYRSEMGDYRSERSPASPPTCTPQHPTRPTAAARTAPCRSQRSLGGPTPAPHHADRSRSEAPPGAGDTVPVPPQTRERSLSEVGGMEEADVVGGVARQPHRRSTGGGSSGRSSGGMSSGSGSGSASSELNLDACGGTGLLQLYRTSSLGGRRQRGGGGPHHAGGGSDGSDDGDDSDGGGGGGDGGDESGVVTLFGKGSVRAAAAAAALLEHPGEDRCRPGFGFRYNPLFDQPSQRGGSPTVSQLLLPPPVQAAGVAVGAHPPVAVRTGQAEGGSTATPPTLVFAGLSCAPDPDKAQSADTGAFPVTQQPSSAPAAHLAGWEPGEVLEGMADAVEGAAAMPEGAAAVADQTQQGPHPRDPDPPGSTTSASTGGARVVPRSSSSGSVLANPLLQGSTGLLQALHGIQAMQDTPEDTSSERATAPDSLPSHHNAHPSTHPFCHPQDASSTATAPPDSLPSHPNAHTTPSDRMAPQISSTSTLMNPEVPALPDMDLTQHGDVSPRASLSGSSYSQLEELEEQEEEEELRSPLQTAGPSTAHFNSNSSSSYSHFEEQQQQLQQQQSPLQTAGPSTARFNSSSYSQFEEQQPVPQQPLMADRWSNTDAGSSARTTASGAMPALDTYTPASGAMHALDTYTPASGAMHALDTYTPASGAMGMGVGTEQPAPADVSQEGGPPARTPPGTDAGQAAAAAAAALHSRPAPPSATVTAPPGRLAGLAWLLN